jgi:hypothetical protein
MAKTLMVVVIVQFMVFDNWQLGRLARHMRDMTIVPVQSSAYFSAEHKMFTVRS